MSDFCETLNDWVESSQKINLIFLTLKTLKLFWPRQRFRDINEDAPYMALVFQIFHERCLGEKRFDCF